MRRLLWVAAALFGLVLVFTATVHLFFPASGLNEALSTLPLIAHGLAFPFPGGVALVALGAVVLLVVLRRRTTGSRPRLTGVLAATSLVVSGVVLAVTTTNIALPATPRAAVAQGSAGMVVVSWNALDHFDGASAQQIFGALGADVAVLPELQNRVGASGTSRIEGALAEGGLVAGDFDIFESPPTGTHIAPLTIIVRKSLARYESVAVEQVTFGTVHLVAPDGSGLPEILAVHTAPPVPRWMAQWRTDLRSVLHFAGNAGANAIIAGDLNATLRHGAMGAITTHADVLAAVPAGERGTWPASLPQSLRSGIDHVFIPAAALVVDDARVIDIPGSDHAAIVATIATTG